MIGAGPIIFGAKFKRNCAATGRCQMSGGHPYSRQCDNRRGVTYFPVVRTYSNLSKRFTTSSGAVVCEIMYGQSSLGYQAAGRAGPEDSIQQDTTNGAEGDGGRPQSEQEADVQGEVLKQC